MHRQSKTLESQQSVKAVDGGHSCGIWAPWSNDQEFMCLGTSFEVKVSKKLGFGIHQKCTVKSKTLESQSWSTVFDSMVLMDGNGLRESLFMS